MLAFECKIHPSFTRSTLKPTDKQKRFEKDIGNDLLLFMDVFTSRHCFLLLFFTTDLPYLIMAFLPLAKCAYGQKSPNPLRILPLH
jgi:hypothetical protein